MKNFVLFSKIIVFVLLVSCSLLGCGKSENISNETQESLLKETISETQETSLQETVSESFESAITLIDIDVQGMLEIPAILKYLSILDGAFTFDRLETSLGYAILTFH